MYGSCSLTILIRAPSLIDKDFLVAAPTDLRTKKAESFSPQLLQVFWFQLKKKNPKSVVMSPTLATKSHKQREVLWQQYHLCLAEAENQIHGGKHFLNCDQSQARFGGWKKGTIPTAKGTIANGRSCVAGNRSGFFHISTICYNH